MEVPQNFKHISSVQLLSHVRLFVTPWIAAYDSIWFNSSVGKESACNAGGPGSIPGSGRSPGKGKGYPLQYSGLENSMDCMGSQRFEHDCVTFTFTFFQRFIPRYILKTIESWDLNRYLYTHVHVAVLTITKRWKQPMSINWWMDKQNVAYTSNGILFSLKKKFWYMLQHR